MGRKQRVSLMRNVHSELYFILMQRVVQLVMLVENYHQILKMKKLNELHMYWFLNEVSLVCFIYIELFHTNLI